MSTGEIIDGRVAPGAPPGVSEDATFRTSWLFLGPESWIPAAGDYFTSYMGDEQVIVCRHVDEGISVLLNECRHRGNKVCPFDRGKARIFQCTYHGWAYDTSGRLTTVPKLASAYGSDLPVDRLGLVRVPRVESVCGMLFGNWDERAPSLSEYLGDAQRYLEGRAGSPTGRLEFLPRRQRFHVPLGWQRLSENFAVWGRDRSLLDELAYRTDRGDRASAPSGAVRSTSHVVVGANGVEHVIDDGAATDRFDTAMIFPNLGVVRPAGPTEGVRVVQWLPKGQDTCELWELRAFDRSARQ